MRSTLKRFGSIFFLILALFATSASSGCRPRVIAASSRFPFAYVQEDCGPTDGGDLEFYFTAKPSDCGNYVEPFLHIEIIENLPKSGAQDFAITSGRSAVLASRCLRPGQCASAISGSLHLTQFGRGKAVSGDYELRFSDGSVEKASFAATWCVVRLLCG